MHEFIYEGVFNLGLENYIFPRRFYFSFCQLFKVHHVRIFLKVAGPVRWEVQCLYFEVPVTQKCYKFKCQTLMKLCLGISKFNKLNYYFLSTQISLSAYSWMFSIFSSPPFHLEWCFSEIWVFWKIHYLREIRTLILGPILPSYRLLPPALYVSRPKVTEINSTLPTLRIINHHGLLVNTNIFQW